VSFVRRLLSTLPLVIALTLGGCATTRSQDDLLASRLATLLADLHERGLFNGALVVGDDQNIAFARGVGYADAERGIPFTPDTPADGASLAKTFTAALVIMLEHDGLLDLDAPAQRLLPELPYAEITLRHLLSHSSGIPVLGYDYFDPWIPPNQVRTTEALLAVIAAQRPVLAFPPGTGFEYSSFGYDLAALAAARAGGKPYAELLAERIFRPLGITSAFVRPARLGDFPGVRTLGYLRVGGELVLNDVFDMEGFHGGSNIYISAADLFRWSASFFQRSLLVDAELEELLEIARIGEAPSGLTLGSWYYAPAGKAHWYSGHLQGFHSEVYRDEESRLSIVYMSNNTIEPWLQKALVRAVTAIMTGRNPPVLIPPGTDEVSKDERGGLAGRWVMSAGDAFSIETRRDGTFIERAGVRYRMVQVGPQAFYVPGLDPMIGFMRGEERTFSRIHVSSNIDEQWGTREALASQTIR
jgi:CubicO group peptidase (beta-lactamase class C family)